MRKLFLTHPVLVKKFVPEKVVMKVIVTTDKEMIFPLDGHWT